MSQQIHLLPRIVSEASQLTRQPAKEKPRQLTDQLRLLDCWTHICHQLENPNCQTKLSTKLIQIEFPLKTQSPNESMKGGLFICVFFCFRGRSCFFWVPGSMLSCFSAFLLLCFLLFLLLYLSTSLLFCFCFSTSLLFCLSCFLLFLLLCFTCFFSFLLHCFPCFSAFLLLCFCAFLLLLFYVFLFFGHVFCCSTSCFSASLLPVFTTSLFFSFSFALFSPVCIPNETLKALYR